MCVCTGGPGCGKGTQCERLVEEFGLTHLSSGDLLRGEVARGSLQGHSIQRLMRDGKLVPPVSVRTHTHTHTHTVLYNIIAGNFCG